MIKHLKLTVLMACSVHSIGLWSPSVIASSNQSRSLDSGESIHETKRQRVPSERMDPLAERSFSKRALARSQAQTNAEINARFQASLTEAQCRMKRALYVLQALNPTLTPKVSMRSERSPDSPLEIVIAGNLNRYPQVLEYLLAVEISNPFSEEMRPTYHDGPEGWQQYPGCALAEAPATLLANFLGDKEGGFSLTDKSHLFNGIEVFPMPHDPVTMGGVDYFANLEPELRGTLVSAYLQRELVKIFQRSDPTFMAEQLNCNLLKELNAYMKSAPILQANIQQEASFHKLSLEMTIEKMALNVPESVHMTPTEKMVAALMSEDVEARALELHAKKLEETRSQLEFLSPLVDVITQLSKLMNRSGYIS